MRFIYSIKGTLCLKKYSAKYFAMKKAKIYENNVKQHRDITV